jgi:uncharacterized membrane protein
MAWCPWERHNRESLMKNHHEHPHKIATVATLLALLAIPTVAAPPDPSNVVITIEDLGVVDAQTPTFPFALNNRGDVVGTSGSAGQLPFLWTAQSGFTRLLGNVPGVVSGAGVDINDHREVIGYFQTTDGQQHFFLSRPRTSLQDFTAFFPRSINNHGEVVGSCNEGTAPCVLREKERGGPAGFQILTRDDTDFPSSALDINDRGQVLGTLRFRSDGLLRGFVWSRDDGFTILEPPPGYLESFGARISKDGVIIGGASNDENLLNVFPVIWDSSGVIRATLASGFDSRGINTQGIAIIGRSNERGESQSFVWIPNQGIFELPTIGGHETVANDINDHGQIAGWTRDENGVAHAVIWTVNVKGETRFQNR